MGNLNIADDVKVLLEELLDDGYMALHEMEVFAFEKFQQLTKANATDVLTRYKGTEFISELPICDGRWPISLQIPL